jgi:3-oxoacyl-[acyl-carrier protein] reductase
MFNPSVALVVHAETAIGAQVSRKLEVLGYSLARVYGKASEEAAKREGWILGEKGAKSPEMVVESINKPISTLVLSAPALPGDHQVFIAGTAWHHLVEQIITSSMIWLQACSDKLTDGASIITIAPPLLLKEKITDPQYEGLTKGLEHMVRIWARELGSRSIRVNAILPGYIETEHEFKGDASEKWRRIPLGRPGKPEDIAGAVAFLAGQESTYITGAILPINGGVHI